MSLVVQVIVTGLAAGGIYGIFAVGWLVLNWRDARHGLWFMGGPLLAVVGLLPLVPLALILYRRNLSAT